MADIRTLIQEKIYEQGVLQDVLLGIIDSIPEPVNAVFSVSASSKVRFSKGNLYWNGSEYKFEENQYDCPSSINTSHIGHFYWDKDEALARALSYSGSATSDDALFTNETEVSPKSSFIVDGEAGKWRTLSGDEWTYLIKTRSGNRYALAKVNDMGGMLIFPDDYSGIISGTGIATVNTDNTGYPSSSIPTATWLEMESLGVVFLPSSGGRTDAINGRGTSGNYLSSSVHYDGDLGAVFTDCLYFTSHGMNTKYFNNIQNCDAIRLVENV